MILTIILIELVASGAVGSGEWGERAHLDIHLPNGSDRENSAIAYADTFVFRVGVGDAAETGDGRSAVASGAAVNNEGVRSGTSIKQ